jgi:hypothetical protein
MALGQEGPLMQAPSPATITILVLVPLVIWRVYSRIRRMVGRQRLSKVRPWITLALFPLLIILFAFAAAAHPERLALFAVAIACGVGLAVYGLHLTRFEATPEGLYYTPHAHLGIALSLLFVARLAWRGYEVYAAGPAPPADFGSSPLTLGVFGLLAGYYIAYAVGLVRWGMQVMDKRDAKP